MTDFASPRIAPATARLFYAVAAGMALFELGVLWLALHPDVNDDYRSYYIDQTSTCLNQPGIPGTYTLGTTVSFTSDGAHEAKPLRVCGWEGPAGDGTHAVGESSRLRFAIGPHAGPLRLWLSLVAIDHGGYTRQRVEIYANDRFVGRITLGPGAKKAETVAIPPGLVGPDGRLDIVLSYPDAIALAPGDGPSRKRSIKLLAAELSGA